MGQKAQYPHYTDVSHSEGIHISRFNFNKKLVWQDKQQSDKDTSICTSTAYEGCETPFIFHMFSIDVEAILDGSKSQLLPVDYSLGCPSEVPRILNSR